MNITEITTTVSLSLLWLWISNAVSIQPVNVNTVRGWITVERGWIEKLYKPRHHATKAEVKAYYRRLSK